MPTSPPVNIFVVLFLYNNFFYVYYRTVPTSPTVSRQWIRFCDLTLMDTVVETCQDDGTERYRYPTVGISREITMERCTLSTTTPRKPLGSIPETSKTLELKIWNIFLKISYPVFAVVRACLLLTRELLYLLCVHVTLARARHTVVYLCACVHMSMLFCRRNCEMHTQTFTHSFGRNPAGTSRFFNNCRQCHLYWNMPNTPPATSPVHDPLTRALSLPFSVRWIRIYPNNRTNVCVRVF